MGKHNGSDHRNRADTGVGPYIRAHDCLRRGRPLCRPAGMQPQRIFTILGPLCWIINYIALFYPNPFRRELWFVIISLPQTALCRCEILNLMAVVPIGSIYATTPLSRYLLFF